MAITSIYEDKDFGANFLGDIIEWIGQNIEPDETYSENQLKAFLKDQYDPEDIFEWDELAVWAEQNGFVHSE